MKRMMKDWLMALAFGVLVFFAIQLLQPKPEIPDEAPDFQVKTLDGEPVQLGQLKGRTVVLNFWATWCGPCKQEVPAFARFAQANPDVPVLGLSVDTVSPSKVRRIAREWGINYPIALASGSLQAAVRHLDTTDDCGGRTRRSGQGHPCRRHERASAEQRDSRLIIERRESLVEGPRPDPAGERPGVRFATDSRHAGSPPRPSSRACRTDYVRPPSRSPSAAAA